MITQRRKLTKANLESLLSSYVSSGNCEKTKKFLAEYSDRINSADNSGIDGEEGRLFGLGLVTSSEMLKLLIDNYVETVIEKQETTQGKMVKKKLFSEMLERQLDETGNEYDWLSDEYKKLLAPWLPKDEDSESEQDLGGFEDDVYDPMAAKEFSQEHDGEAEDFGQNHSSSPRTPIEYPGDFEKEEPVHAAYSGQDYKMHKEFIESQITDIKLSASAEIVQGGYSGGEAINPDFASDFSITGAVEDHPASELE